jgi:hypothetical protein
MEESVSQEKIAFTFVGQISEQDLGEKGIDECIRILKESLEYELRAAAEARLASAH